MLSFQPHWLRLSRALRVACVAALLSYLLALLPLVEPARAAPPPGTGAPPTARRLAFEPNLGQFADPALGFRVRAPGMTALFAADGMTMALNSVPEEGKTIATTQAVRVTFQDAGANSLPIGNRPAEGRANYFIGDDPTRWRTGVPTYGEITYRGLWPGVDLTYGGDGGQIKSTYTVAGGADANAIGWCYEGVQSVELDGASSALRIRASAAHELRESAPRAWQETARGRTAVSVTYEIQPDRASCVGFKIGQYDRTRPLIIDPTLLYSSYLGGSLRDAATDVALGPDGEIYVTGATFSPNFPTAGAGDSTLAGTMDAFVAKLSADGSTLLFSTYLGGAGNENLFSEGALAVDAGGDVYVTGESASSDFPRVSQLAGVEAKGANGDIFVVKLSSAGSILYSSLIGSGTRDLGLGIAVDDAGNAYVAGSATGADFPLVAPLYQYKGGDAVLFKVSPSGSQLLFSTYFGSSMSNDTANDVALDAYGAIYITGETLGVDLPTAAPFQASKGAGNNWDAFLAKFSGDGRTLLYASYFGGTDHDAGDSIAVDAFGQMIITGVTRSRDLPTAAAADGGLSGASDAFVAKFSASGGALVFSTYLGGSQDENLLRQIRPNVAVDGEGAIFASGFTYSRDFPSVEQLPGQVVNNSAAAYLTKLGPAGSIVYSTLYGGPDQETGVSVAVDAGGTAVIAGETRSTALPLVQPLQARSGGGASDAFVARIAHGQGATVQIAPPKLIFADQAVNQVSAPQSFFITALAQGGLPLSSIEIQGPQAAEFTIAEHNCPIGGAGLPAQAACRVVVTFRPAAGGLRTARVVIASPSWSGPRVAPLLGHARPAVSLNTNLIQFLAQKPGTTSTPQHIVLTNIGSEPLALGAVEISGPDAQVFSLAAGGCSGQSLAPGAGCTVEVRFSPSQLGARFAEVRFSGAAFSEQQRVALQGTGAVPPSLALTHKNKQPGAADESPLCTCTGRILLANGTNFPPGSSVAIAATSSTGATYPLANVTADAGGSIAAEFTMPEIGGGGLVTVSASATGQPSAAVVVRTPRTDMLPVILIPGVSASTLVARGDFAYVAPPDPNLLEFGYAWHTANPLAPEKHIVLNGHTPWLDNWAVGRLLAGQYRYLDMLMLKPDGATPAADMLGTTPKIGVGSILWDAAGQDFFGSFRTMLQNRGYEDGKTLFYFPYDWRKDLTPTADQLGKLIQHARHASGKDQVVLIAHSMGGLVARNYIVTYGAKEIDQVISIGTPYLGAPLVAKVLEVGDAWGIEKKLWGIGAGMHPNEMRKLGQNFPSAYQLSPAKGWFSSGDPYLIRARTMNGKVVTEPLDYMATQRFMAARHNPALVAQAERFHSKRVGDLGYLTDQYYAQRIVGIGEPTPGRIEYTSREICGDTLFGVVCIPLLELAFPKLDLFGDNTVPYASALGNSARDGRVYALPGTHHSTQPAHPKVQKLVGLLLEGKLCDKNQIKSLNPVALRPADEGAHDFDVELIPETVQVQQVETNVSGLEVIVLGSGDLSVIDAKGRLTGRDRTGAAYTAKLDIPGSGYDLINGLQIALLPAGQAYEIRLSGIVTGAAQVQVSTVVSGVVVERVLYEGVATTLKTAATLKLSGGGLQAPPPLLYSYDGTSPAREIQPLPTLRGAALEDLTPPSVQLAVNARRIVTIVAEDNPGGVGVHRIYYETDISRGKTFAYTGPFVVPNGAGTIRAFAVDKAGNSSTARSELKVEVHTGLWLPSIRK